MTEDDLHKSVADYLRLALLADAMFTSTLNEGLRGWRYQRKLKDFGVMPGWPDVTVLWRGKAYFIELKRPAGTFYGKKQRRGEVTKEQDNCHTQMRNCWINPVVCYSLEEVQQALRVWGIERQRA